MDRTRPTTMPSRHFGFALAAVLACVVLSGCSKSARLADSHLERAGELLDQKRVVRAEREIASAIRANPSRAETYRLAMGLYVSYDLPRQAAIVGKQLVDRAKEHRLDENVSDPERGLLLLMLGEIYIEGGETVEAETVTREALTLRPNDPQCMNALAYLYADHGFKLNEALMLARRAAAQMPEEGAVLDTLGWAQYRLGQYADAITNLKKAIEQMPDDATLRYHLGAAYERAGHLDDARLELRKALLIDSKMSEATKLLSDIES